MARQTNVRQKALDLIKNVDQLKDDLNEEISFDEQEEDANENNK